MILHLIQSIRKSSVCRYRNKEAWGGRQSDFRQISAAFASKHSYFVSLCVPEGSLVSSGHIAWPAHAGRRSRMTTSRQGNYSSVQPLDGRIQCGDIVILWDPDFPILSAYATLQFIQFATAQILYRIALLQPRPEATKKCHLGGG
jgi:hypothetical protein